MTGIEIWNQRLKKGHWTDVQVQLPPVGKNVVILQQEGEINIGRISNSNTWYDWQIAIEYGHVTHWQPKENIEKDSKPLRPVASNG
jgi:hypothetical protein